MAKKDHIKRRFWIEKIEKAWQEKSVIWLAGVRRAGKTTICESLNGIEYFDCEYPDVRAQMEDPRLFLKRWNGKRLAIDEIHNLNNPSQLLKLAADHFPETKIIAIGSSTLDAKQKFKDTMTDRYLPIHLTPMLLFEGELFGKPDIDHRLLFGGLPPFFLKEDVMKIKFSQWIDNYWAKDIQKLFRIKERTPFITFTELVLAQSGGIFEASKFAEACEVHRKTIKNYLSVLETTYIVDVIRPYSLHPATEIKLAPRVYGFDTGFVCHMRGWYSLRPTDNGPLWEHIVLNEIKGQLQEEELRIHYWRDKQGHEIDFVILKNRHHKPIAVECKWTYRSFNPEGILLFRNKYPAGKNYVVCANIDRSYEREYNGVEVTFISLENLIKELSIPPKREEDNN